MMSKAMSDALNQQLALEAYASFLYLSMANWCDQSGLNGCAQFLYRQSDEERLHMMKIVHYMNEVDGKSVIPSVNQPPAEFESVQTLFENVFSHEQKVTSQIHKLIELCNKEDDYATLNFLQWYVAEQREEEALMRSILDKIRLIGNVPQSLYWIDKELDAINKAQNKKEAAEAAE